jgi:ABC-type glycerol-3-phosphate transport system permease component
MRERGCRLKCPNCGEEILGEEATFCPNCGSPLKSKPQPQSSDYVLASAILALVAGSFTGAMGYIALYQYSTFLSRYEFSLIVGFLIFGVIGVVSCAFAISGAAFMLKRKFFIFSILGAIFPAISAFVTFITVIQYEYGFTDTLIFSQIATVILAILSAILLFKSRNEFTDQD